MTSPQNFSFSLPPALALDDLYKQQNMQHGRTGKPVALAKKGAPWSDEEHKAFLAGLKMYGRGQWKQISRYYVPSRTPTQVASHAQKHFLRQSGAQKRRSRFASVEEAAPAMPQAPEPPLSLNLPSLPGLGGASAAGPAAMAGSAPGVPALFAQGLPPAQHAFHLPPPPLPRLAGAPGSVVGGVAMGVPIGVLPPLPSITTASGTELPILPVMPGRINAMACAITPPPPLPTAATTSYSGDSAASEHYASGSPSPPPDARPPYLRSRASLAAAAPAPALPPRGRAAYAPSGRTQQLLRLLELNEQHAQQAQQAQQQAGSAADGAAASSGSAPVGPRGLHPPWQPTPGSGQQDCVRRVPSATAALDTLALLAEAESAADSPSQQQGHAACAPLVSAF